MFRKIKDFYNIFLLKKSSFFDKKYYKLENPDVCGNLVRHYYYIGYKEGRNPSEKFDNDYYLKIHKDVKDSEINPLVHYLRNGKKEKRKIRGFSGLSISKIYDKLYREMYHFNIHYVYNKKETNIIVYAINETTFDVIKKICEKKLVDKIIYVEGDIDLLKMLSIKAIKCYSDYYVDIGINDVNICVDSKSFMLFNRSSRINNFCFYIDDVGRYSYDFINYLSYYALTKRVKIISFNGDLKIHKPVIRHLKKFNELSSVNFVFDNNFIFGLEVINSFFLENYNSSNMKLFYEYSDLHCKVCLDNGMNILPVVGDYDGKCIVFGDNNIVFDGEEVLSFVSDEYLDIITDFDI